jgi:hypothetical protein
VSISKTTTNLRTPTTLRARFDGLPLPVAIGVVIFCLLGIVGAIGRIRSEGGAAAVPTAPLPIIIIASPLPQIPPTAVPQVQQVAAVVPGNVTRRAIVVYGAADLTTAIGAVEPGRAYQVLAKNGTDWLQIDMSGGTGVVFVRTVDLFDLPADLVDLQPPPQPQVVYVSAPAPVYAPEAAAPVEQPAEAAPTPAQQYLVLSERQTNIQQHYVEPTYPTLQPMEQNPVTQEWARQQWAAEHEVGR